MALEDVLKALAEAVAANTAAVTRNTELLQGALAAQGKAPTTAAAASNGAGTAAATTVTTEAPKKGPGRPRKDAAAATTTAKSTAMSETDMKNFVGTFLKVDDADEKQARRDFIGELNEHYGVQRVMEIPQDKWPEVVEYIRVKAAGGDVILGGAAADAATDEGDGDDALI